MRVLVCGSRDWTNPCLIRKHLYNFDRRNTVIITGGCRGADQQAESVARHFGYRIWTFHANWERGPRAGPERNADMLEVGRPDLVLAFHNYLDGSRGTKDMVNKARAAGVPVRIITETSDSK